MQRRRLLEDDVYPPPQTCSATTLRGRQTHRAQGKPNSTPSCERGISAIRYDLGQLVTQMSGQISSRLPPLRSAVAGANTTRPNLPELRSILGEDIRTAASVHPSQPPARNHNHKPNINATTTKERCVQLATSGFGWKETKLASPHAAVATNLIRTQILQMASSRS